MRLQSYDRPVGTTPSVLFSFRPSELNSVAFQAVLGIEIGVDSVEIGAGYPIAKGSSFGFNKDDVDAKDTTLAHVYGVASVATEVRVLSFMKV